jgi:hypothetical protein
MLKLLLLCCKAASQCRQVCILDCLQPLLSSIAISTNRPLC